MTAHASDAFTRADSATTLGTADVGGAWTAQVGTWGILSNKAYCAVATSDAYNIATLTLQNTADVTVSCDVTTSATANRTTAGLALRYTDVNNWVRLLLFKEGSIPNSIYLQQTVSGTPTTLANLDSAGLADGTLYNLKAVIAGTTIAVYLDNVLKIAATSFNSGLTTQKYGPALYKAASTFDNGGSRFDNFLVTVFTGVPRPQQAVYRM